MPLPTKTAAVCIHEYNQSAPWEGVKIEKVEVPPLQPGHCLITMLFAPITPSDLNVMEGVQNSKPPPSLPIMGNIGMEGCGQIIALYDDNVEGYHVGDVVISWQWGWGTYAQYVVAPLSQLVVVPTNVPPKVASMMSVNPPTGAFPSTYASCNL